MQMILQSEEDVRSINCKYIVQLNTDKPNQDIRSEFFFLKRVYKVTIMDSPRLAYKGVEQPVVILTGFYNPPLVKPLDTFKDWFNTPHEGKRFHRLLTNEELDWLCEQLKEFNYRVAYLK